MPTGVLENLEDLKLVEELFIVTSEAREQNSLYH